MRPAPALLLALAAACAPLDRTTPFRSHAYAAAVQATARAIEHAQKGRGPFEAGWARAEIEAPPGVPLAGYGARKGAASTGVRDPAYARAFAIRAGDATVLLFTADLLLITPELAAAVRARLAPTIAPDRIFFTASHTHSGPGAFAHGFLYQLVFGSYDPQAFEAVADAHVRAARSALSSFAPVRIGSADVDVPGIVANRVEKMGPVDERLFALLFERPDGKRALFWSFGCHAVTLSADNLRLSADYPGAVAGELEDRSFEVVGFAAGGVGSAKPRSSERATAAALLSGLARAVERARREARWEGSLTSASATLALPPPRYRITQGVMIWPALAKGVLDTGDAPFGAVAVGDTVLVHLPGEPSSEITREVRERARRRGIRLALLPFNGKWLGYLVSRRTYDLAVAKGAELFDYETRIMSFFGPHEAALFLNLAMRLGEGVHRLGQ